MPHWRYIMKKRIKTAFVIIAACVILIPASCVIAEIYLNSCKACALYCVDGHAMLSTENARTKIAPASLTKLMTSCVALRNISADEVITVGTERWLTAEGSSVSFILPGHRLKLYDLLSGMLMVSGNDAAYTTAVYTARKVSGEELSDEQAVEYFCKMMNELAAELEMHDSHFANPDGWDDPEHYTTASDLVKLAEYALTFPEIRKIAQTQQRFVVFESGESITWTNSNKLIDPNSRFYCSEAIGLKTGTTKNAGNCLIGAFVKDGKTYITVAAGCASDIGRYRKTLKLVDKIDRSAKRNHHEQNRTWQIPRAASLC